MCCWWRGSWCGLGGEDNASQRCSSPLSQILMTSLGARMKGDKLIILGCLLDCQQEKWPTHTCCCFWLKTGKQGLLASHDSWEGFVCKGLVQLWWWAHQSWLVGALVGKYMRFTFWQLRKPGRKNMILANRVWSAPPSPGASCRTWDGQKLSPARPTISSTTTPPTTTTTTTTTSTTMRLPPPTVC